MTESDPVQSKLQEAALNGEAFRVSKRHDLDDGQEFIVHFNPSNSTIHIATPAITSPELSDVDVYENPNPTDTADDLLVHVTRYDATPETTDAQIVRVTNNNLTTTAADKTEETRIGADREYNTPGDSHQRGIWRSIPPSENVSFVVTDRSGGTSNTYGFDTMVYEGNTLRD